MAGKRGNGEGTIGQYNGRWIARYVAANGQRKAVYGATRAETAQKLAAAIRDRDAGQAPMDERVTVGAFLQQWLEQSVKGRNRPSTYVSYAGHVKLHIAPRLGHFKLGRLTPSDVERFMAEKVEEGLSPSTVTRIRSTLRRALAVAQRQGLVFRNVAALADPPRVTTRQVTALNLEEARAFIQAVQEHRFGAIYVAAIATGLRRGELLGLTWQDVDLDTGTLTVRRALQRINGTYVLVDPKTTRSLRTVSVPPLAVKPLRDLRARQTQMRQLRGADWNPLDLVFTSPAGKPVDGSRVSLALQRIMKDASLPRIRFHDLRHTCASLLLAQGTHMRVIMEQLGHSQISLTMNTYSHVMPEAMHDASERLQQALSGSPTPP